MKKIHLLSILLLVLIFAALGRIAAGVVSHRLTRAVPVGGSRATAAPAPAAAEDLSTFAGIVEKGLFGKATQGKLVPIAAAPPKGGTTATAQGDLILVGTARGALRETFALIRRSAPPEERVFRLGEKVFELGTLVSVQKDSAEILAGGRRIRLLTPTAVPAEPLPAGGAPIQAAAGSYVIDQRTLNAALDNIGQAMTDARLLPSVKDGKVEGFRVSEVKPAGIFGMVGIKNGDVLLRINDLPVDSPERAIQSLASLKGQSRIKLDLVRDGQPATFSYDIR